MNAKKEVIRPSNQTPASQRPSIGRIVHYHQMWNGKVRAMMAAIIDLSNDPDRVTLKITDPNGGDFVRVVERNQAGEGLPEDKTWDWPPRV